MRFLLIYSLIFGSTILNGDIELKEHEKWWEVKCKEKDKFDQFAGWIGGEDEFSRMLVRKHMSAKKYQSVLDIPCGLCIDYLPLKKINPALIYVGIDITESFVSRAKGINIPALHGRIQNIPCSDSSFDIAYSRHILEHLDSYEQAIKELVRVAKKEVLIVFFRKPQDKDTDVIMTGDYVDGFPIYHNLYSKTKFECFLNSITKIKNFIFEDVPGTDECILHIML